MFEPHSKTITYRYNRIAAHISYLSGPILATALCWPNAAFAQAPYGTVEIDGQMSGCAIAPHCSVFATPATDVSTPAIALFPFQSDGPSGQSIVGDGVAAPGKLSAFAKLSRPDNTHGLTGMQIIAQRYEHFLNDNSGSPVILTLRLVGDVTVTNTSNPAGASLDVELFMNKHGTPWSPEKITPCPPLPATLDNCMVTTHTINSIGSSFMVDHGAFVFIKGDGFLPTADFRVPTLPGFDYTIHTSLLLAPTLLGPVVPEQAELNFEHTGDVYLDSPDDSELSLQPESNHDYSDPSRYTSKSTAKSDGANRPIFPKTVADPQHKLIGGGAQIRGTGAGALTGTSPLSASSIVPPDTAPVAWLADGSGSSAASYGIQLNDPLNLYKVVVTQSDNGFGLHSRPTARAVVPPGYALVGGGCQIKTPDSKFPSKTNQNDKFVTGSFPDETEPTPRSWICESQTQARYNPGVITAYAVGITPRSMSGADTPTVRITKDADTGPFQPTATANVFGPGFIVTGCGARVTDTLTHTPVPGPHSPTYQPQYEFLTAIFPVFASASANEPVTACQADASDLGTHHTGGNLSTYTISALFQTAKLTALYPNSIRAVPSAPDVRLIFFDGDHFYPGMLIGFLPQSGGPLSVTSSTPVAPLWTQYFQSSVHHGSVSVPNGLTPGDYLIGVVQGDVLSGGLPFTIHP